MSARAPFLLLACSQGGHLYEMMQLKALYSKYAHAWVCLPQADAKSLLKDARVFWAYGPTNRSVKNLLRNLWLAWGLLRRLRPTVILSTGAAVGVPFLVLGRLLGMRTVYIESFARQERLSLTGAMMYRVVHDFLVQNPALAARYPRAQFHGKLYEWR